MNNFDQNELDKFSKLADEWWDPNGKFKPLHLINPLRSEYISKKINLEGLDVLDIGCGGGILAESLTKKGANVTAIDLADGPLNVAKLRAQKTKLNITPFVKKSDEFHFDLEYLIVPQTNILFKWKVLFHEIVGYFVYKLMGYV